VVLAPLQDAAVAMDAPARARLWAYRERHTESISAAGIPHKLDVALPLAGLAAFRAELDEVIAKADARAIVFGHIGAGNLHVNVLGPAPDDDGVDDAVLEAIGVGATGWVAGLANALPHESVDLFNHGIRGEDRKAFELYRWFLPLLRMDTVPKFVQLIKVVQAEVGMGGTGVRPPRLELVGNELEQAKKIIRESLRTRPESVASYALPNRK